MDLFTPPRRVSAAEIEAAKTPKGGWTKAQFEAWGVPFPPPKGWKARLTGNVERVGSQPRPSSRLDELYEMHEEVRFALEQAKRFGDPDLARLAKRDAEIVAAITEENWRRRRRLSASVA